MRHLLLLTGLLILLAAGCSTDKSLEPVTFNDAGYPRALGTYWTYVQTDSTHNVVDTFTMAMNDLWVHESGVLMATITSTRGDCISNLYVAYRGDSVSVLQGPDPESPRYQSYLFPLRIGDACHVMYVNDSMRVVARDRAVTPAATFQSAFVLEREYLLIDSYYFERLWFVPGIGVVQRYIYSDEYSMGTTAVVFSWALLRYHVPD